MPKVTVHKKSSTSPRQAAATATSGLGGILNIVGSLARAAGVMVTHVAPGGSLTGKGLDAIGEQLQEAGRGLGAASSLIGGSVVVVEEAEVIEVGEVPKGRKPRKTD
jgi:hypothetical protein